MEIPKLINVKLISHPMNWVMILLMLVIAGAIGHKLLELVDVHPATADASGKSVYSDLPAGQVPSDDFVSAITPNVGAFFEE